MEDDDKKIEILGMLRDADGDAKLMLALLDGFCDRHSFKLVAAVAEDLAHGFLLLV